MVDFSEMDVPSLAVAELAELAAGEAASTAGELASAVAEFDVASLRGVKASDGADVAVELGVLDGAVESAAVKDPVFGNSSEVAGSVAVAAGSAFLFGVAEAAGASERVGEVELVGDFKPAGV